MTYERIAVEALGRCQFAPGTWDKKFARAISSTPEDFRLSSKQRANLWRLTKKYRRQMPPLAVSEAERWLAVGPDERAFQDALDDNPADFGLRLVYADWLRERGRDADESAQRWMAAQQASPKLVPCGQSYGPNGTRGCNFEWSFGMDTWNLFTVRLSYHHRGREAAESALARAISGEDCE